ncbi:MAG: HlyD family secretion protein [Ferruginibacter sp.]
MTKQHKHNSPNRVKIITANITIFIIVSILLFWLVKKYFHMDDDNYTEAAQVEEFINPINTRVSAYIKEIRFIEHQSVKKGDTLIILDNSEILTQFGQAEAAHMSAIAAEKGTHSAVNTVFNNIGTVEANIAGAKARLWNAEQNLTRYNNLLQSEAVTQQQYDQVKTEFDAQKANCDALENQRNSATFSTAEVRTKLGMNDAEIKRTKSALDMARLNLSYTVITAPTDGVMERRLINEGQLLQPGQQVATIVLNGEKWITANFLEKQMSKVNIGEKLNLAIDALDGKVYEGVVTAISAATGSKYAAIPVDNATGNFVKVQQRIPVRIEFTAANSKTDLQKLRAGMNVNVTIK